MPLKYACGVGKKTRTATAPAVAVEVHSDSGSDSDYEQTVPAAPAPGLGKMLPLRQPSHQFHTPGLGLILDGSCIGSGSRETPRLQLLAKRPHGAGFDFGSG